MTSDTTTTSSMAEAADPRRWVALGVIALSTLIVVLDVSIVNIALPQAQEDLGISDVDRHWVVTAYALTFGGLLLLGGRIGDFVGRKNVLLIGLAGFAVASVIGGLAPNAETLSAGRTLQGAFAALLAPAALSLVTVTFTDPRERAKAFGVYGAVAGGGGAVGLLLGGVLTEYADWRWTLFVNVPITIVAIAAAVPTVRESRSDGVPHYDIPGTVLVTAGLVALVYGFTAAGSEDVGWGPPVTLGSLVAGALLLVGFVIVEARTAHPLLPLSIVLERNRGGAFIALLLIGAGMFSMFLFLTYYFQVNLGYRPMEAGLAFLPFSLGIIITAVFASGLIARFGPKPLLVGGIGAGAAALFWLSLLDSSSTYATAVLPPMIAMSVGLGLVFVILNDVALTGVGGNDAGIASAVVNSAQQIGGALGTAPLNTVFASAVVSYVADHEGTVGARRLELDSLLHGYGLAFLVGGSFFIVAMVSIVVLVRIKRVPPTQ